MIVTQASPSVTVGGQVTDTATLTGGTSPTGTLTFVLYGPDDATCAVPARVHQHQDGDGHGQLHVRSVHHRGARHVPLARHLQR